MIFVLKFGAWRMSVFATDRRHCDNGILVSSLLAVLHVKLSANKLNSYTYMHDYDLGDSRYI